MKAVRFAVAAALLLSIPALAAAAGVHSIWSDSGMLITDNSGSTQYPVTEGGLVISWSESTGAAFANLHGRAFIPTSPPTFRDYDFELISGSASFLTEDVMVGQWNIRRNGALVCGNCRGTLIGLDAGSSIQFFDSTNKFRFFANVGTRKDY